MKKLLLTVLSALILISCNNSKDNSDEPKDFIYSVNGKVNIGELGVALTHEHVMSRFGADAAYDPEYDKEKLFAQVIPYLKEVKALGVGTIFDCTTAWFGRDAGLLKEMSDSSGIELITNTGYYAAASDKYVPESAFSSTAEEIADIWINEFEDGIDNTGIKPGFIKLAFDNGEPSEIDTKLFIAGIHTHLNTGLTMAVHTGNNPGTVEKQLELLEEFGANPSALVWVHAGKSGVDSMMIAAARKGAWLSLDKFKAKDVASYIAMITELKEEGLLGQILLSHDGNSYPNGGSIRGYQAIMLVLVPALKEAGFTEEEINQILVENPRNAFKIDVREN